jgi:hypothetical protein
MTWINHATPSGFGGLACLLATTFISPLRGYSLLGMPATSAQLGGVQALNVFLIAQHITIEYPDGACRYQEIIAECQPLAKSGQKQYAINFTGPCYCLTLNFKRGIFCMPLFYHHNHFGNETTETKPAGRIMYRNPFI